MNPPVEGDSSNPSVPAVLGSNTAGGIGVKGSSDTYQGVCGVSVTNAGVAGESSQFHAIYGVSHDPNNAGVIGINDGQGWGVTGRSEKVGVSGETPAGDGVVGTGQRGVVGTSSNALGVGVFGSSDTFIGIVAESNQFHGVRASTNGKDSAGVFGVNNQFGWGVIGKCDEFTGVSGTSAKGVGVHGQGGLLAGFFEGGVRVNGELYIQNERSALRVDGPVQITGRTEINGPLSLGGTMTVQSGGDVVFADLAEQFEPAPGRIIEPGAVVVLTEYGQIESCHSEYDTRVAGVVSGAGHFRPAMVLDIGKENTARPEVALMGKVFCKVEAIRFPIRAGDLLTSSSLLGHAMKAGNRAKSAGAVIGKALKPLTEGVGLIPILVTLQ